MPEWWTYDLADAQIFSARSYDRLVERCMHDAWPAQVLVLVLGLAILVLPWWRPRDGGRALAGGSACACASVAAWWLPQCYAQLHWATGWMAGGFALQAGLLVVAAAWAGALDRGQSSVARACSTALFAFALFAMPLLSMPEGGGLWRAELAGLMPAPTIAASLAVVPLATLRWRLLLLPLPIAGTVLEAVTSASIDRAQWALLPVDVMALAAMLLVWRGQGAAGRREVAAR